MRVPPWDDLRYLLAIYRGGSFAAAARLLDINQSTVSRRLDACEALLGSVLFERANGRLAPTAAGRTLIDLAERIERSTQEAFGEVAGTNQTAAGTVRITAVPWMVNRILAPNVGKLTQTHTGLRIELVAERRDLHLTRREADLAVRLARPERENRALARKIGTLRYAAYASSTGKEEQLPWIGYDEALLQQPHARWIERQVKREDQPFVAVTADDAEALLACVRNGAGKSLLPSCLGDRDVDLKRLLPREEPPSREIWLLAHPDLKLLNRMRLAADWVCAEISAFVS